MISSFKNLNSEFQTNSISDTETEDMYEALMIIYAQAGEVD